MTLIKLNASIRPTSGTGSSRALRAEKAVPAVLYGQDLDTLPIAISEAEINQMLSKGGSAALMDLTVDSKNYAVMIKEIQRNHMKGNIIHVDFHSVNLKEPVHASIPVLLEGESPGVKGGGILQQQLREVEVKCLPTQLPARIELDISTLGVGESLHASDLMIPPGVELVTSPEETVVSILAPRLAEEPATEETGNTEEQQIPEQG